MVDLEAYQGGLFGIGMLLLLVFVQWLIASGSKAKQAGAVPGAPPRHFSHHDFTFRAWRTHQNSLENLGTMLGASFLAILAGANPTLVSVLIAIMVAARFIHMLLYYLIATQENPSPRSYFFLIAWLANLLLLLAGLWALI